MSCRTFATLATLLLAPSVVLAATWWTGPSVNFTKAAFANHTLAQNQDRLTPAVWLTRADFRGLINIAQETVYTNFPVPVSPLGTQWALGSISMGVQNLTFNAWETTVRSLFPGAGPPDAVNQPMVVHLVAEDIYLDLTMTSWAMQTGGGGAFSYTRSSPATPVAQKVPAMPPLALAALFVACAWMARRRQWPLASAPAVPPLQGG